MTQEHHHASEKSFFPHSKRRVRSMGCEEKSHGSSQMKNGLVPCSFVKPVAKFAIQNLKEMSISSKQFEEIHTKSDAVNIAITRHGVGDKNRRVGDLH